MNPRISKKERGLIKGALRRVFSRSDLRREALSRNLIDHNDLNRPRVTKWAWCSVCGEVSPAYKMQIDHIMPVVDIDKSLEQMDWNELVDRLWCDSHNLQTICLCCHKNKGKIEAASRRKSRKDRK